MKTTIIIIFTFIFCVSCDRKGENIKDPVTQLDSLIGFDSIISIYSFVSYPIILREELSDELDIDSTNYKWTNEQFSIKAFKETMPRLDTNLVGDYDTTANFYIDILIVTKHKIHTIGWIVSNKEKLVEVDGVIYSTNKIQLEKAISKLSKRIVLREIYKKDFKNYNTSDFYNSHYLKEQDTTRENKMYVFTYE